MTAGDGPPDAAGPRDDTHDGPRDADPDDGLPDDEVTARARDVLRSDPRTTSMAEQRVIRSDGRRLLIRGVVDDLDDEDDVIEVVSRVSGIEEVISDISIRSIERSSLDPHRMTPT